MFQSERKPSPAAPLHLPAAGPAAGIASTPYEALLLMPAAPFSEVPHPHGTRQREIADRQCRWIIADEDAGAEALMCGAPVEPRRPFCTDHCARAFMKIEPDEDAEAAEVKALEDEDVEKEAME